MWMNSLGIEGIHINNLYEEAKDGLLMLKVIDKIEPGIINWARIEKNPGKNQMKRSINASAVIEAAKKLDCKLPGIDASQILKGSRKAVLAIVW